MAHANPSEDFSIVVLRQLRAAGHTAYWAGGCVRDRLMGLAPKDYDVATSATPDQVLRLFPRSQKVGAAFGVILVRDKRRQVEVATFRADGGYSDGRHPDSVRFTTPEEDAQRRDFTCNGLFFDPLAQAGAGELHDFVGGERDIQARILRAIGDPAQRFAEDHLRMLRAIRFAARLSFAIEPDTRAAILALQQNLATISRERIGEELRMMLEHPTRVAAVELLAAFPRMFAEVFGFIPPTAADSPDRNWPLLAGLPVRIHRVIALMAIGRDAGIDDPQIAAVSLRARLVLSNDETAELAWLYDTFPLLEDWEDLSKARFKRIMAAPYWKSLDTLYRADPDHADQILAYHERTEALHDEGVAPVPFINGARLIALGAAPGPHFKTWLDQLYDQQLDGLLPTPESALAAAALLLGPPSPSVACPSVPPVPPVPPSSP